MTLDHLLGDHPTTEQQLAVIVTSLSNHIKNRLERDTEIDTKINQLSVSVERLVVLQREQNGNVATIKERQNGIKQWVEEHTDWHGKEDKAIAERLNISKGRLEVIIAGWKIVVAILGSSIVGAGISKGLNLLGVW